MDFADPSANLAQFGLKEGGIVVDMGAGSGHYSFAASRLVGTTGHVYAVDVQKELLERLKKHAREEGLGNIEVVWGDIERARGVPLRDGIADVVILSNVLFQVEDKRGLALEASRLIKGKGRIFIVDWDGSYNNLGPAEEMVFPAKDARALFENMGYTYEHEIEAGQHHYGFSMGKL